MSYEYGVDLDKDRRPNTAKARSGGMTRKVDTAEGFFGDAEAREFMASTGWLSRVPVEFSQRLLASCVVLTFGADEKVYNLDDPPGGLYGLVSGRVGMWVAPQERGPYLGHIMRPGHWFGLASALNRKSRAIGLRTIKPSQLLLVPMNKLDQLVADAPGDWRHFTVLAELNTAIAMAAVDDLLIRSPSKRCAAVLLRLAGLRGSGHLLPPLTTVDVTQDELAHLSNLSRNTAGVVLRELEMQGVIELGYRSVIIRDAAALLRHVAPADDE